MQPLRFGRSHRGCPGAKTTNVCPSHRMLSSHSLPALRRWPCVALLTKAVNHQRNRPTHADAAHVTAQDARLYSRSSPPSLVITTT